MTPPVWSLPADDPNDSPIQIHLDGNQDLPTLGLEIIVPGGFAFLSPTTARRLAMTLNASADYAESCVLEVA